MHLSNIQKKTGIRKLVFYIQSLFGTAAQLPLLQATLTPDLWGAVV